MLSENDFLTRFLLKGNSQEGTREVPLPSSLVLPVTTGCLTNQLFEDVGSDDPCCDCTKKEEHIQAPEAAYKKTGLDLQVTGENKTT